MKSTFAICATALTGLGLLLMPVAAAQAQAPAAPPTTKPGAAPSSAAISDNKLDAAAAALKNVSDIRQSYEQKVDRAPAEDKGRLQSEATAASGRCGSPASAVRRSEMVSWARSIDIA